MKWMLVLWMLSLPVAVPDDYRTEELCQEAGKRALTAESIGGKKPVPAVSRYACIQTHSNKDELEKRRR